MRLSIMAAFAGFNSLVQYFHLYRLSKWQF